MAGAEPSSIDLLIVATVTPDMSFPSSSALLADQLGMPDAAAYDLSAGCTGFVYAIAQAHAMLAAGLAKRALVVGGDVLSKILDWSDRSTVVLFGDGAGAVVMERGRRRAGSSASSSAPTAAAARNLWLPGSGSRQFEEPEQVREDERPRGLQVRNSGHGQLCGGDSRRVRAGRSTTSTSTFRTRRMSGSSITLCEKLGVPQEKTVVNVDQYGNTSSGSIPLALADAADDGRLEPGKLVLLTGMGAGLTWGSALIEWTHETTGAAA